MSDPVRLLDDPSSPLAQSAIEAWSAERPSADARARALALSTLVSGAAVGTAAASATGGALTGKAIGGAAGATKAGIGTGALGTGALSAGVVKGLLVAALIAGGSATVVVATHMNPAPESASESRGTVSTAQRPRMRPPLKITAPAIETGPSSASAHAADLEGPSASVDDLPLAPALAASHPRAPLQAKPAEAPPASSASVAAELMELDDARASLRGGDAARALAMLDAFEAAHSRSSLRDEATVVRVDALLRSGDRGRAVELARGFVARSPTSPYAPRLRRIVESSGPNAAPNGAAPAAASHREGESRTIP